MKINSDVKRLEIGSDEYNELSHALELVIEQPVYVTKGHHANLVYVMSQIFGVHLDKFGAVANALYALWREEDILFIESDDRYIAMLKKEKLEEQRLIQMAEEQDL